MGIMIDDIYQGTLTKNGLFTLSGIFLGVILVNYVISSIWGYQLFGGSQLLARSLRTKLMDHFLKMRAVFYEKFTTGDLMARTTNDLDAVSEMAGYGIMVMLDSTVFLGAVVSMMFLSVS